MMMATIPRVSSECAEAVLYKALADNPVQFALDTLVKFHADQPELAAMIAHVADTLVGGVDDEEEEVAAFKEVQLTTIYALIGLTYGSIKAQIEADEMEDAWS
tara:strand:- start:73 stop:381 length:309 start_codon:yes stop_codon:yes gene_type:complete